MREIVVQPGQIWWCDGAALAFEAHFKRRPVLVVAEADEIQQWHVMPLSSSRRYGQEVAVTHEGGASYMTGALLTVPASALRKPLGAWAGFAAWQADQERAANAVKKWRDLGERLRCFLRLPERTG